MTLRILWTVACQAPLSMGFCRQEHWRRLSFPSPGAFPEPGIKPGSPALQAHDLPTELYLVCAWVYTVDPCREYSCPHGTSIPVEKKQNQIQHRPVVLSAKKENEAGEKGESVAICGWMYMCPYFI